MPLTFNHILEAQGIDPADVRLLRHLGGKIAGQTPYTLWRDDRPLFEAFQAVQTVQNRARLAARYWASFVTDLDGRVLLAGVYAIGSREPVPEGWPHPLMPRAPAGEDECYALEPVTTFDEYAGRVYIEWGAGAISWIQRADAQPKSITEISRGFAEPPFPGFSSFVEPLSRIQTLPTAWTQALAAAKGIYLLTCPATREAYVGAAMGADGFIGRWREYATNGHGGNVRLMARDPSDYQVTILEVAGSRDDDGDIRDLETRWKLKLQSREMGLNAN